MDRSVKLTIHGNLVPKLGMLGDVPLLLAAFIHRCFVKHGDRFPAIAIKLFSHSICSTKILNARINYDGKAAM
jgi:hypothetical protein